jgi:hypothetical protein
MNGFEIGKKVTTLQCDPQRPYVILISGQVVPLTSKVTYRFPWMMKYAQAR